MSFHLILCSIPGWTKLTIIKKWVHNTIFYYPEKCCGYDGFLLDAPEVAKSYSNYTILDEVLYYDKQLSR